jgi:thioredoxin-like negative regulator of GroEL
MLALAGCRQREAPPARLDGIAWQSFGDGLSQARAQDKPVLLVVRADWCPHCRNYEGVFKDPAVVEAAKNFVAVRVDEDREPEVAARFRLDGAYVPRTYFLAPDGSVEDVQAANPRFRYFYDEHNPASILTGMRSAMAVAVSK